MSEAISSSLPSPTLLTWQMGNKYEKRYFSSILVCFSHISKVVPETDEETYSVSHMHHVDTMYNVNLCIDIFFAVRVMQKLYTILHGILVVTYQQS